MRFSFGPGASNIYSNDRKYQLVLDWSYDSIYFKYHIDNKTKWIIFTTKNNKNFYQDNFNDDEIIIVDDINNINFEDDEFKKLKNYAIDNQNIILKQYQRSKESFEMLSKIK